MSTEQTRVEVCEAVRRMLGAQTTNESRLIVGEYRGVPLTFVYSAPEEPQDHTDFHTSVHADLPRDYPLYLRLTHRAQSDPPDVRAPFFAAVHGKAAPIDIATNLLDAETCDALRQLQWFSLTTFYFDEYLPKTTRVPPRLTLSAPGWVEDPELARRMIEIVSRIVRALADARTQADAAAGVHTGSAYRAVAADPADLHRRRLAEIDAERGISRRRPLSARLATVSERLLKFFRERL